MHIEGRGNRRWEVEDFNNYVKTFESGWNVLEPTVSDKVEPIPLTPEVLEKAGFVKVGPDDFHNSSMWKKEGFTYLYCDGSFVDNSGPYGHYCDIGNMEHLHQLQNLYLALTGEELNIEL